jgi:hypothetical protein
MMMSLSITSGYSNPPTHFLDSGFSRQGMIFAELHFNSRFYVPS